MNKIIPYGKQEITTNDIDAVIKVLQSDSLTQGPEIEKFENAFAKYVGSNFAIAVSNGTAALHLTTLAIGLKPNDKVITTSISFSATANCIRYCGGEVVFCDIDPDTYLIDLIKLEELLKSFPKGTFKGIIPVDFAGRPVDLEKLRYLANEYECWIIQDSCHSPGGFFKDSFGNKQNCGNGVFADMSIFSFHPVKHIACGEGGMITTNNEKLYKILLKLRTHGITKNSIDFVNPVKMAIGSKNLESQDLNYPLWYMEMQELGYNYRLTDFQAALGYSQLERAEIGLKRRVEISEKYFNAFKDNINIIGQSGVIEGHAYHLYIIEVEDRLGLYNYLRQNSIYAQVHYFPIHLMPYYRNNFLNYENKLLHSENYYERCLSLPMYPTLTQSEQDFVIDKILKFYEK
jgi:UDP-4-amino-4,6-dideoxy-N-acetyl-beta-L-altrosamine transaminase